MITIDGSQGEGGGQVLRSALSLSLVTGRAFTITNIRAGRKKPGLMRQHLTAVNAAAEVGRAKVTGATLGSAKLIFEPGEAGAAGHGGDYHFAVGTAGSATLVLQTVLPPLLIAAGPSSLRLEGGTHNPWAPPFDFLARTFLPLVNRMGPTVEATLVRPGFYPAGGGEFLVSITPAALRPIELLERGAIKRVTVRARVARLPRSIAEREVRVIGKTLDLPEESLVVEEIDDSRGPGNVVTIEIECEQVTEVFTGFGQRGVPAEAVADRAAREAQRYLSEDVPVGEYLTDQLLIPLAMSGGGVFRTLGLSSHAETNIAVVKAFLEVGFEIGKSPPVGCIVRVRR